MKDFNQRVNEVFKFLYEGEFKRKDELDKILSFPVTLITLQSGAAFFVFKQHITQWNFNFSNFDIAFFTISGLFALSTALAVIFMVAVFHGPDRRYKHLPYAQKIDDFREQLIKFHKKPSSEVHVDRGVLTPVENVDEPALLTDFTLELVKRYEECSTRNAEINDKRNNYYYWVRTFIVFSTLLFFIVIIFGLIDFVSMSKTETQTQKPQTATQAPVKPTLAPAREVKEQPMPNIKTK